jgi:hypothetical protein
MSSTLISSLIQTTLVVLIQVLVPVLLGFAIMWVKQQIAKAKSEMTQEQINFITELARTYVMAAEQNGLAEAIANEGAAKKEWVLTRLQSDVSSLGLQVDIRMLSDLVESQVYAALKQA